MEIRPIYDNDIIDAINLMNKIFKENDRYGAVFRDSSELSWIQYFCNHVEQSKSDSLYYVPGCFTKEGELVGFIMSSVFLNYYTNFYTMDIKDCIVDQSVPRRAPIIVKELFDSIFDHMRKIRVRHWRADSVRDNENAHKYADFLIKRYGGSAGVAVRGELDG